MFILFFTLLSFGFGKQLPFSVDEAFFADDQTKDMLVVYRLSGKWLDKYQYSYQVPFVEDEEIELTLHKTFNIHQSPDTFFLYFEGLSGTAEIYWNEKLLTISDEPFQPILIPITKAIYREGANQIKVHLKLNAKTNKLSPEIKLGIHKPVYLLTRNHGHFVKNKFIQTIKTKVSNTVLVYAPFHPYFFYNVGEQTVERDIQLFKKYNISTIYFSFNASNKIKYQFTKAGFSILDSLPKNSIKIFYNKYPLKEKFMLAKLVFWYDENRQKAENWGFFQESMDENQLNLKSSSAEKIQILFLGLLPVFVFFLLKLLFPKLVSGFKDYYLPNNFLINQILEGTVFKAYHSNILNVARSLVDAAMLSIFYKLFLVRSPEIMEKIITSNAFLIKLGELYMYNFYLGFAVSLILFLAVRFLKYLLFGLIAGIYRYNLERKFMNIDILASFPITFFLGIIPLLYFYSLPSIKSTVFIFLVVIGVIFLLRKYYILWKSMDLIAKFPFVVKILYFCAFEILPWVVLIF